MRFFSAFLLCAVLFFSCILGPKDEGNAVSTKTLDTYKTSKPGLFAEAKAEILSDVQNFQNEYEDWNPDSASGKFDSVAAMRSFVPSKAKLSAAGTYSYARDTTYQRYSNYHYSNNKPDSALFTYHRVENITISINPDAYASPELIGLSNPISITGNESETYSRTCNTIGLVPDSLKYFAEDYSASGVSSYSGTISGGKINAAATYTETYRNITLSASFRLTNFGFRKSDLSGTLTMTGIVEEIDTTLLPSNYAQLSVGEKERAEFNATVYIAYTVSVSFTQAGIGTGTVTSGNETIATFAGTRWHMNPTAAPKQAAGKNSWMKKGFFPE